MSDLNQVLHEKVMGECWHEDISWDNEGYGTCGKCQATDFFNSSAHAIKVSFEHPDYLHDPAAYWRLLQKVADRGALNTIFKYPKDIINRERGCEAIADFFVPGWRKE